MSENIPITERHRMLANNLFDTLGIAIPITPDSNASIKQVSDKEYARAHKTYIGFIRFKALAWNKRGAGDYDDLVQEGRLQLHKAMESFTPERGSMKTYLGFILDNRYRAIKAAAFAQCRTPYIWELSEEGEWVKKPYPVASISASIGGDVGDSLTLLDTIASDEPSPLDNLDKDECRHSLLKFRARLYNKLGKRERKVYDCLVRPTPKILILARNMNEHNVSNVTIPVIAMHMGITKNQVDYSLLKIKKIVGELVSELSENEIELIQRSII